MYIVSVTVVVGYLSMCVKSWCSWYPVCNAPRICLLQVYDVGVHLSEHFRDSSAALQPLRTFCSYCCLCYADLFLFMENKDCFIFAAFIYKVSQKTCQCSRKLESSLLQMMPLWLINFLYHSLRFEVSITKTVAILLGHLRSLLTAPHFCSGNGTQSHISRRPKYLCKMFIFVSAYISGSFLWSLNMYL